MNFAKSFNKAPISIAVACAMLTPAVIAQSAESNDDMVEVIEVRASSFADSLQKALITKRASAGAVGAVGSGTLAEVGASAGTGASAGA